MKKIDVTIIGNERGLLQNNPIGMTVNVKLDAKAIKVKGAKDIGTPREEAEKLAYWTINPKNKKKELYIPSEWILRSMINASSFQKIGKASAKTILAGSVFINPDKILLGTDQYEIDIRTVVIQRMRVVKARPQISNWKASFVIDYNEDMVGNPDVLFDILTQAGQRVGVGDFRPQRSGSFGTFVIEKWVPQK